MKHLIHHRPDKQGYFLIYPLPQKLSDMEIQLYRTDTCFFASFSVRRHALKVMNIFKFEGTVDNEMCEFLVMTTSCGLALAIMLSKVPAFGTEDAIIFNAAEFEFLGVSGVAHVEFLKHHVFKLSVFS
jgi:hypothetical protein